MTTFCIDFYAPYLSTFLPLSVSFVLSVWVREEKLPPPPLSLPQFNEPSHLPEPDSEGGGDLMTLGPTYIAVHLPGSRSIPKGYEVVIILLMIPVL